MPGVADEHVAAATVVLELQVLEALGGLATLVAAPQKVDWGLALANGTGSAPSSGTGDLNNGL